MRRTGIAPEYTYVNRPGTFNMTEKKSFMGSKIMSTDDSVELLNQDIIYYEQINGEQTNLDQEITINPVVYSVVSDKKENQQINLDNSQEEQDKNLKTKWVIDINIIQLLRNYIFTEIKGSRSFEGVLNTNTVNGSVNDALYDYIDNNIIDLYKLSNINLYIKNISLQDENRRRLDVRYNHRINSTKYISKKYRLSFNKDKSFAQLFLTQEKNSKEFIFDYYFDLIFTKK